MTAVHPGKAHLPKKGAGSSGKDHFTSFPTISPITTVLLLVCADHHQVLQTEAGHTEVVGVCKHTHEKVTRALDHRLQ